MSRKRFDQTTILLLALLIVAGFFFIQLSYTGYVTHLGSSTPSALIGHLGQDGVITTTEHTFISIVNKGSTAQLVTVKFWNNYGSLIRSANSTVNPDRQWQLITGSGSSLANMRYWVGYFTIEANDVSKLYAQAYIALSEQGSYLPITISPLSPIINPAPSPTPTSTSATTTSPPSGTIPDTTLTSTPRSSSISTSPSFSFTSTIAGSTFECSLDGGTFEPCTSPKRYTGLSRSSHTFSVRARDAASNIDPTPATFSWRII